MARFDPEEVAERVQASEAVWLEIKKLHASIEQLRKEIALKDQVIADLKTRVHLLETWTAIDL